MPLNLFDTYRGLLQRARRNPHSAPLKEARVLGRALVSPDITVEERISIAEAIERIELASGARVSFGHRARVAIACEDWHIRVPYQVKHRWAETKDSYGYIYIASSNSRPGELKIGATGNSPFDRERTYKTKFGYSIKIEWYKFTQAPFSLEKEVTDSIRFACVAGLTYEDSNEWYEVTLKNFIAIVEKIDSNRVQSHNA